MRQLREFSPEGSRSNFYRTLASFEKNDSILVVGHTYIMQLQHSAG